MNINTKIPIFNKDKETTDYYKLDKIDAFIRQKSEEFSTKCKQAPDELYWEAKSHLYQQSGKFNPKIASFRTWATTVLRNYLNQKFRSAQKFNSESLEIIEETTGDKEMNELENREYLKKIMPKLTLNQQEVVKMLMDGDTKADIARKLKCSPTTIRDRIRGIRKKIKDTP